MSGIDEALDHLVYATPDLRATVDEVHRLTGARPVEGGRHLGLGTRNHLLGLGGRRYLEIIGPDDGQPEPGVPRPFGIDTRAEPAMVTWAIRAGDLQERVERARRRGYDPGDVEDMSRRTPDGDLLTWRLAFAQAGLVPFLIDWGTTAHPTEQGLPTVPLTSFTGSHPEPGTVQSALDAIGAHLDVTVASSPALTATLDGPSGQIVLT
ncbi:VOC family protein [Actinomadura rubrisoli]|uniref:VOC family protein n=1 Tax=Actinomadura rubrisoli TaxID=2530368 RepID=A0A4R5BYQ3_9ACTN|nr:VOC family protein [Actinomadura rubrisoli]TDD91349.1 VOC family protein [Actinomadura rubrisoli]